MGSSFGLQAAVCRAQGSREEYFGLEPKATTVGSSLLGTLNRVTALG